MIPRRGRAVNAFDELTRARDLVATGAVECIRDYIITQAATFFWRKRIIMRVLNSDNKRLALCRGYCYARNIALRPLRRR